MYNIYGKKWVLGYKWARDTSKGKDNIYSEREREKKGGTRQDKRVKGERTRGLIYM